MSFWGFRDYVSVAERRKQAVREVQKLKKAGRVVTPVVVEGRKIAQSVWGKAWCDNLERYSDFETRLPRGRTYVRNGSVIDLKIERGQVQAMVSGSAIYKVKVDIAVAAPSRWRAICADCSGSVGSLVELLQGRLSNSVMERVCRASDGLFPAPAEIKMSCSCPDWADMCKHVAAVLYGVGARLDATPELLFILRGVDHADLVAGAGDGLSLTGAASERILVNTDVAALFGLDIETSVVADRPIDPPAAEDRSRRSKRTPARKINASSPRRSGITPAPAARQTFKHRSKAQAPKKQAVGTGTIETDEFGKPTPRRSSKNARVNVAVLCDDAMGPAPTKRQAKRPDESTAKNQVKRPATSRAKAKDQATSKNKSEATSSIRKEPRTKAKAGPKLQPDTRPAPREIGAKLRKEKKEGMFRTEDSSPKR